MAKLADKMYVRLPFDPESKNNPRRFICGRIVTIDTFANQAQVEVMDPFGYSEYYTDLPYGEHSYSMSVLRHCALFIGSEVLYRHTRCKVLTESLEKDGYYYYYLQKCDNDEIFRCCESELTAAFNNGRVDPFSQLASYELQEPCWYIGRTIVSRSMNVLDHSIHGFKELAGCKIYLLPHQINTIMRCLKEDPCRFMLADEVGMGKTIEAISVLKVYFSHHSACHALIVVPKALKKQWIAELVIKFDLSEGKQQNDNVLTVRAIEELTFDDLITRYDFVIIDEVHRYLSSQASFDSLHTLSTISKNVLLLSATPVQQRKEEYLGLMRLLAPEKYDAITPEHFEKLVEIQNLICQKTTLVLDDLSDYEPAIADALKEDISPIDSEDCQDLFEEIVDDLHSISERLEDSELELLLEKVQFGSEDFGVYAIKLAVSYICSNYQIESHVIRNRRRILEDPEDGSRLLPVRALRKVPYALDRDLNLYEALTYDMLVDWISENSERYDTEKVIQPLLSVFFSSPQAFCAVVEKYIEKGIRFDQGFIENSHKWAHFEDDILMRLKDILNDPFSYEAEHSTRLVKVMDLLYDELYDQKVVLFTNSRVTFKVYQEALSRVFGKEEYSCFGAEMRVKDLEAELEQNAYRFQNEQQCRIMLCDYTGGEGRNFQCADYIIHIDLPWNASMVEQRIGRLDRLERDPARNIVTSIVVYAEETFEQALFDLWDQGLNVFTHSLSGMEIVIREINDAVLQSLKGNFRYRLFEQVPRIVELTQKMQEQVRKERNYDAAAIMFKPMYTELKRTIDYYNRNDNALFATTMTTWASLAGFVGATDSRGCLLYSPSRFSPRSAMNSLLTLPNWAEYIARGNNQFSMRVERSYQSARGEGYQNRTVRGTFVRKQALENDYLHFFAPGDELFDAIANNALLSSKGQICAMAVFSQINWTGFIITVSVNPDETMLLDQGVSIYAMNEYRNALPIEQIIIPYSIANVEDHSEAEIRKAYREIIDRGFMRKTYEHLGRRSGSAKYLKEVISEGPCLTWFKRMYPPDRWKEMLLQARKYALEEASKQVKQRLNLRGIKEEMERNLSARQANERLFGISDESIDRLRRDQQLIIEAFKHSRFRVESAAFIWMIKETREDESLC